MTKTSVGKLSILGLVLLSASAVTAAVNHSHSKATSVKDNNGTLVPSANNKHGQTCRPGGVACHDSVTGVSSADSVRGGGLGSESNSTTV